VTDLPKHVAPCQLSASRQRLHLRNRLTRMRGSLLSILMALALLTGTGCAGAHTGAGTTASAPAPTAIPAGTMLFRSDWTHGVPSDWHLTRGWTLAHSELQSSTADNLSLALPYQPPVPNYAVEFRVLVLSVPAAGGYFALTADPANGKDGYRAAVDDLLPQSTHVFALHPQINVTITPADPPEGATGQVTNQVLDFEHDWIWRTYRVEVLGNHATLWVDQHRMSYSWSANTQNLSTGPMRFECGLVALRVADFRVIAL